MARLRSIEMTRDGEDLAAATITFSLPELVFLAKMLGKQNHNANNEVMPNGAYAGADLYRAVQQPLISMYEDGDDDQRLKRAVTTALTAAEV